MRKFAFDHPESEAGWQLREEAWASEPEWRHAFLGFVNLKQILLDLSEDLKPIIDGRGYPALVYTSLHEGDVCDMDRLLKAYRESDSKPIRLLLRL